MFELASFLNLIHMVEVATPPKIITTASEKTVYDIKGYYNWSMTTVQQSPAMIRSRGVVLEVQGSPRSKATHPNENIHADNNLSLAVVTVLVEKRFSVRQAVNSLVTI